MDIGLHLSAGRTYNLSNGLLDASMTFDGGTLNQTGGVSEGFLIEMKHGTYNLSAGTVTTEREFIGNDPSRTAVFTQSGGTHETSGLTLPSLGSGRYDLRGGTFNVFQVVLGPGGTFNQTGGTLKSVLFEHKGGTVTGVLQNQGRFEYSGGNFSGRLLNQGIVNILPAALTLGDGLDNRATFAVPYQLALALNGATSENTGMITLDDVVLTGSGLVNRPAGTVSGSGRLQLNVVNMGTVTASGGNLVLAGSFDNQGTIGNGVGSNLFVQSPSFTNSGDVEVRSAGSVVFSQPLINLPNRSITLTGGALAAPSIDNRGHITGAGDISGNVSNSGGFTFNGPTHVFGTWRNLVFSGLSVHSGQTRVSGLATNETFIIVNHGTLDFEAGLTSPGAAADGGLVRLQAGSRLMSPYVRQSALFLEGAANDLAQAVIRPRGSTSVLAQLTITNSPAGYLGRLDIADTALIIDYTGASPLASTRAYILSGYATAGARWTGTGLTSSSAASDPSKAIGYAEAADVLSSTGGAFRGQQADGTSVLVRYTFAGDATLDGVVGFADLVRLAQNYNQTVSTTTEGWWGRGDFTYDGKVGFEDLVKLAQNYSASLPAEPIPGAAAGFDRDLAAAFASVPEPSALAGAAALGGLIIRSRRQRPARHDGFSPRP
jgi:hypothetical protein